MQIIACLKFTMKLLELAFDPWKRGQKQLYTQWIMNLTITRLFFQLSRSGQKHFFNRIMNKTISKYHKNCLEKTKKMILLPINHFLLYFVRSILQFSTWSAGQERGHEFPMKSSRDPFMTTWSLLLLPSDFWREFRKSLLKIIKYW